jgi:hypothetical protein
MIKKSMKKLLPLIFGLLTFGFFMLLYLPSLGSEDFITGLLVFFAALATSATIILPKEGERVAHYFYMLLGVVLPVLSVFLMKNADRLWHLVTVGLYFIGLLGLNLFVFAYLDRRKGENNGENKGIGRQTAGDNG